jgi:hypothetical protein
MINGLLSKDEREQTYTSQDGHVIFITEKNDGNKSSSVLFNICHRRNFQKCMLNGAGYARP